MKKENDNNKGQDRGEKKTWNVNKRDQQGNRPYVKPAHFDGRCSGLKGQVFDCSDIKNFDKFQMTLKEIVTYVNKEYHNGQDIGKALETMAPYQIPIPTVSTRIMDPDPQLKLKKQMVIKFLKREMAYEENLGTAY
eukprot:11443285-Ditylum_brightwellii.AAC.1